MSEAIMTIKKLEFKYSFSRREPKLTESVKAAARKTFGDVKYTAGPKAPKRLRKAA
jgi:hypothetical protein